MPLAILVGLLLTACGEQTQAPYEPPPPPSPPDLAYVGQFNNCSARPQRDLSEREKCEVAAFQSRCTALDDCFVSCISSKSGSFDGGRCAHTCTFGPHKAAPPPDAIAGCKTLTGRSGVDVE
jgi:hypothetical protein